MRIPVLAAAAAALLAVPPAQAASLDQGRLAGAEVFRNAKLKGAQRDEKWVLGPDGRLTGTWAVTRDGRKMLNKKSGRIVGRWSVEGGRLCVKGAGLPHAGKRCFKVTKNGYSRQEYAATDTEGVVWQLFIISRPGRTIAESR